MKQFNNSNFMLRYTVLKNTLLNFKGITLIVSDLISTRPWTSGWYKDNRRQYVVTTP